MVNALTSAFDIVAQVYRSALNICYNNLFLTLIFVAVPISIIGISFIHVLVTKR